MTDIDKINSLNQKYDKKTIKIEDTNGNKQQVKMSVFQEGMTVTPDVKDAMTVFDTHKDDKLDKEEVALMKKAIAEGAGSDKTLDDNEILKIFGLTSESENAAKILKQFKTMVERQNTGHSETTTDQDGKKITSNFNSDGSGTVTITENKDGVEVKTVQYYGKGKVLEKKVTTKPDETITSEYTNNDKGKPVTVQTTVVDKEGKLKTEIKDTYTYNERGQVLRKDTEEKGKTYQLGGQKIETKKTSYVENEYDAEGNLVKRTINKNGQLGKTTVITFNKEGKPVHQEVSAKKLSIRKDANGKTIVSQAESKTTTDYTYDENGNKTKVEIKGVDSYGQPSESVYTYESDGKTIKTLDKSFIKRGAKVEEHYEGSNIDCRIGLPTTKIEYEEDGVTIKQKTVNKFDDEGILIGREVYDKDGKLLKQYDFSEVDGKFEVSNQLSRGDCYLLASINALASSDDGQKILQDNVKVTTDENGKKVYTVSFPGAKAVKDGLAAGSINPQIGAIPSDKIFIQESYTITEDELKEAAKQAGCKYSAGDKDVLLLEVAYEKYRKDAYKTRKENGIPDKAQVFGINVVAESAKQGDYLSGGKASESTFLLSGKKAEEYKNNPKNAPVCYIDSDLNMHLTDENGQIIESPDSEEGTSDNAKLNSIMSKLEQDSKDGKIDNFAATVSFNVSSQEVNGRAITGGGHAFTILKVTNDQVTLSNPWSPDTPIVMSRADFEKAATNVMCVPLNAEGEATVGDPTGSGSGSGGGSGSTPGVGGGPGSQPTTPTRRTGSPRGWYRSSADKSSLIAALGKNGKKPNASQVLNAILRTKFTGKLTPQQQEILRQQIIRKNPSVFDSKGNPLPNADYNKLDIPTMAAIRQMFNLKADQRIGRRYDHVYTGKVVYTTRNGDYMKKVNGKFMYFTKDGRAMTEAEFKKAHPTVDINAVKSRNK